MKKVKESSHLAIFFADRHSAGLAAAIVLMAAVLALYISIAIDPTEVQLATRYTSFGEAHYYRNRWEYLIGFVVFVILYAVSHVAIMSKLYSRGMRSLAIAFGWLGVFFAVVIYFLVQAILGVAYLQ